MGGSIVTGQGQQEQAGGDRQAGGSRADSNQGQEEYLSKRERFSWTKGLLCELEPFDCLRAVRQGCVLQQ